MRQLLELFIIFSKIGAFTFGGGYAMLPLLTKEVVERRGWASNDEILNYFAIGQCSPGIIFVNTATFIGFKRKGVLGGIFATLGSIFPSLVIITVISMALQNFMDIEIIEKAFGGIRVVVCALIFYSIINMSKDSLKDKIYLLILISVFLVCVIFNLSSVLLIILMMVLALFYSIFKAGKRI